MTPNRGEGPAGKTREPALARRMKVILLEDDEDLRGLLAERLRSYGYEVAAYATPIQCCPSCSKCTAGFFSTMVGADILVTDNRMPDMTGTEFIERMVKCGCALPPENCCVLSSYLTQEEEERIRSFGCQIFPKTISEAEFEKWLRECRSRTGADRLE
jgi:CheY-like chemotaxis protein